MRWLSESVEKCEHVPREEKGPGVYMQFPISHLIHAKPIPGKQA